jgi:hypothetical protein
MYICTKYRMYVPIELNQVKDYFYQGEHSNTDNLPKLETLHALKHVL